MESQSTRHDLAFTGRRKSENLKMKEQFVCSKCKTKQHWKMITNTLRVCDIKHAIKSMSHQEKYPIFKNHAEPAKNLLFPKRYDGECYRMFSKTLVLDSLNMFPCTA